MEDTFQWLNILVKGISLFFDTLTSQYIVERDNSNDTIGEPFTNINYLIDFNFNKVVNKGTILSV